MHFQNVQDFFSVAGNRAIIKCDRDRIRMLVPSGSHRQKKLRRQNSTSISLNDQVGEQQKPNGNIGHSPQSHILEEENQYREEQNVDRLIL